MVNSGHHDGDSWSTSKPHNVSIMDRQLTSLRLSPPPRHSRGESIHSPDHCRVDGGDVGGGFDEGDTGGEVDGPAKLVVN